MSRRNVLLFLLFTLMVAGLACGCTSNDAGPTQSEEGQSSQPSVARTTTTANTQPERQSILFKDSLDATLIEEQAHALPVWREYREQRPPLLVFSSKLMQHPPAQLQEEIKRLLASADTGELERRTAGSVADRLLNADMGVAAALRQGWISRLIWVVPLNEGQVMLPLADFKKVLHARAAGWGDDIDTFRENVDGGYSGYLGGISVDVVSLEHLPDLSEPVLVHMDTGFFAASYDNEVKTPLYKMILDVMKVVSARNYSALRVTISRDTSSYEVPLPLRFLGRDLAAFVAEPARITVPGPRMKLRRDMLYLDSFYQPETIKEKAQELVEVDPQDAGAHFSLYRALRQAQRLDLGLAELEQAIALDPAYADEYIELVNHAIQKKQDDAAVAMLDNVIRAVPDNPLVRLRKAQLLVELGRRAEATDILVALEKLPWSEVYYPQIINDIAALQEQARKGN